MEGTQICLIKNPRKTYNVLKIIKALQCKGKDKDERETSISPSEYMKHMLFNTQERINEMIKLGHRYDLRPVFRNSMSGAFKVTPDIVIFQRFAPGDIYDVTFTVRNITQVSRHVKMSFDSHPYFAIEYRGSTYNTMLAPGLAQTYNVRFTPGEKMDYEYYVKFVADNEEFEVPIIAIGPRPILDFPDQIEIPTTAVKIPSSKTFLVCNIGDGPAIFKARVNCSLFWIEPSKGILEEKQTVQFTVYFLSVKSGDFEATLFIESDSDEILHVDLRSSAINCMINLEPNYVKVEETYLGMSRSDTITIHNRSDYVVNFQWMLFHDSNKDLRQRQKYEKLFELIQNVELVRCVDLEHYNICTATAHELVCHRIYADEIESLLKEKFEYNHPCFTVSPQKGEIWPRSSVDITVIFYAMEVGTHTSVAYLEITSVEDRIPLRLSGIGKGPTLCLNVVTIEMGDIYLCSVHNFEVIAFNKSCITGTLVYAPEPTEFGGTVEITPTSLTLGPNEHKSYNLQFFSNRKGDFVERVNFVIKESLEVIILHIKGFVICPTLNFDKESLDFGVTALGFSNRQDVCLRNLSSVPVTFSITVLNDGDETPLTFEEFSKSPVKLPFPSNPREFHVSPDEGVVPAYSFLKIKVTYTANRVRKETTTMKVDMWDTDSDPVTLPLVFCGAVASLSVKPSEISIRFCFINFPYTRTFTIENTSDIDGYFFIVPQKVSDLISTVYSMSAHQGFLKAHQSKTITVTLITRVLGKQRNCLSMFVMGENTPTTCCVIICNGQGPVVSIEPTSLDFGDTRVLEENVMSFRLISDAPIPAEFKISLNKKYSPWSTDPSNGVLEPNKSIDVNVKLYLRDVGKHSDDIVVSIINSRDILLPVSAIGIGFSIVFEPPIFPVCDMGLLFSHQNLQIPITMKNLSTRQHRIIWSNAPVSRVLKYHTLPTEFEKFHIIPSIVELQPGESSTIHCKIRWDVNETVTEDWYVYGQAQSQGKVDLFGLTTLKITFTEPQIIFSKKCIFCSINMSPYGDQLDEIDEFNVTNKSRLDLNVNLTVESPFYLLTDAEELVQKLKIILLDQNTIKVRVKFLPEISTERFYSEDFCKILWFTCTEHPNKEKIKCYGSVNFPNLVIIPNDITISTELGLSAEKPVKLINPGPVPILYKLKWIRESIQMEHDVKHSLETSDLLRKSSSDTQKEVSQLLSDEKEYEESKETPIKTPTPPTNTPASESSQKVKATSSIVSLGIKNVVEKSEEKPPETTREEVKEFLLPLIQPFFAEDTELLALENVARTPPDTEDIDKVLDVVPFEGTVPPYSSQVVHFSFHGLERVQVKAVIACEIVRGPTEMLNVLAVADAIRYSVSKRDVVFGQQLFCEACQTKVLLTNLSDVKFTYKVDEFSFVRNTSQNLFNPDQLKIEPDQGEVDPNSSLDLKITYYPMCLGPFEVKFKIEIGHFELLTVHLSGIGTFPQVYLCVPRVDIFEKQPVELGYSAIQALSAEFTTNTKKLDSIEHNAIDDIYPVQIINKFAADWEFVTDFEYLPTIMDIDMAIERFLATGFIYENYQVLLEHTENVRKSIPYLTSPEYLIDLGYLVVDQPSEYVATLINYGPWNVDVILRNSPSKYSLAKLGIFVEFGHVKNLDIGNTAELLIRCHPIKEKFPDRYSVINQKIFFEVTHGCNIPINIKGIVTYPFISVDTHLLDFGSVIVGKCLSLTLLIKNDGLIECHWDAKIFYKRNEDCPFYLDHYSDTLAPDQTGIIRAYFKPRKMCNIERRLRITTRMGREKKIISMKGQGVELKLNITESAISFLPVIPCTETQEKIIEVTNISEYPVEFVLKHLFLLEEHI